MMIFTALIFLLSVLIHNSKSLDPCQTPNGQKGNCVTLQECSSLSSHLDHGVLPPKIKNYLRMSHCGFDGSQPKVCCPSQSPLSNRNLRSSNLLPDRTICGVYTSSKIIGGEKTELDEFPWMALLQYKLADGSLSFECGGSLINKRYVLTAAHCLLPELVSVRLGEYNTETNPDCVSSAFGKDCAAPYRDFGVEEQIAYKSDSGRYHDIGLIRLDRDVEYTDFIKPICLPSGEDSYIGQNLTVAGWGITEQEVKSTIKLKVNVPVKELSDCVSKYKNLINVNLSLDSGQICAGGVKGMDSCRADSGGPLMHLKREKHKEPNLYAVGVVSFGPTPCGQKDLPGVYTKVSKYVNWIVQNIKP